MPIVPSQTQRVIVNPANPGISVINAGPMGATGPTGPSELDTILADGDLATKTAGAVAPISRANLANDTAFTNKYVPKTVLTSDGQLVTRASGLLVPITRADLANDTAFTSKFAPLAQGIRVFANAAARDAAITSPSEGMAAFLSDTKRTTWYLNGGWRSGEWGSAWGVVGTAAITGNSASFTSTVDITGLSVTWTAVTGRYYEIVASGSFNSTVSGDYALATLADGSGTPLNSSHAIYLPASGYGFRWMIDFLWNPGGGSKTAKIQASRLSGSGTTIVNAASSYPARITVKDMGPT